METCQSCGTELAENAKYCQTCGAPVDKNTTTQEFSVSSDDLTKKVKELLHEGNVTRIIVKDEKGNTFLDIPVIAGAVGVLIAPWLAALGVIAAFATRCTIVVVRKGNADKEVAKPA
jgi:hypothetical protein